MKGNFAGKTITPALSSAEKRERNDDDDATNNGAQHPTSTRDEEETTIHHAGAVCDMHSFRFSASPFMGVKTGEQQQQRQRQHIRTHINSVLTLCGRA